MTWLNIPNSPRCVRVAHRHRPISRPWLAGWPQYDRAIGAINHMKPAPVQITRRQATGDQALSVRDQRDHLSGEPLQAFETLGDGLAAAVKDQLVHTDRGKCPNIAGDPVQAASACCRWARDSAACG
jgi:hypothetical protein